MPAVQFVTGGRGLIDPMRMPAGYQEYHKLDESGGRTAPRRPPPRFQGDGVLTFDRLTDVYHSGTRHEEDQPCHLHVLDTEYLRGPLRHRIRQSLPVFLSRGGVRNGGGDRRRRLKINASNCVHCKTCDIADPYQIIDWVPPEGGGGPNYEGM